MTPSTTSLFSSYNLSDDEILKGSVLNPLQKAVFQNLLASAAADKIRLKFTPNDINSYLQAEAELQGKINMLENILIMSDDATSQLFHSPSAG